MNARAPICKVYSTLHVEKLYVNPQLEVMDKYISFAVTETQENMKLFSSNANSYPCTTCAILQQFIVFCSKKVRNVVTDDEHFPNACFSGQLPQGKARLSPAGRRTGLLDPQQWVSSPALGSTPEQVRRVNEGAADSAQVLSTRFHREPAAQVSSPGRAAVRLVQALVLLHWGCSSAQPPASPNNCLPASPVTGHSSLRRTVLPVEDLRYFPVTMFCVHLKQMGCFQFWVPRCSTVH